MVETEAHKYLKKQVAKALERVGASNIEFEKRVKTADLVLRDVILKVDVAGVINGKTVAVECGTLSNMPYTPKERIEVLKKHFDVLLQLKYGKKEFREL